MDELLQIALAAYRANRFPDAVELLEQITEHHCQDSMARLYLAMAYEKAGRITDAHKIFQDLTNSPDEHIRIRANTNLPLIEAKMQRHFQKDTAKADDCKAASDVAKTLNKALSS